MNETKNEEKKQASFGEAVASSMLTHPYAALAGYTVVSVVAIYAWGKWFSNSIAKNVVKHLQ